MSLTKEDLQAIEQLFDRKMDEKLVDIKEDIANIKSDVAEMKESLEEVRTTTNSLVAWADNVAVVTQVTFPVKKANNG